MASYFLPVFCGLQLKRLLSIVAILALLLSLHVLVAPSALADQTTAYKCHGAGCKYAKMRVQYWNQQEGAHVKRITKIWNRGGTATGPCVTNNSGIDKWRIDQSFIANSNNGNVLWSRGATTYRTNCDPNADDGLRVSNHDTKVWWPYVKTTFWHVDNQCSQCSFPGSVSQRYVDGDF